MSKLLSNKLLSNKSLFPVKPVAFNSFLDTVDRFWNTGDYKMFEADQWLTSDTFPKADVFYTDNNLIFQVAVPGIAAENITVEMAKQELATSLIVSGQYEFVNKEAGRILFRELRHSKFSRMWSLPNDVDESKYKATLKDGILTVSFEKKAVTTPPSTKKIVKVDVE